MSRPSRVPVVLDCDTGIDDALALSYLLASPSAELLGVTCVMGNVTTRRGARNTLDLLAVAGHPDVPVHLGAMVSLDGSFSGGAPRVHGDNGLGDAELPTSPRSVAEESAPAFLVRMAHAHPGELVVVAVGPLTNLALALSLDPGIARLVRRVVVMGGAVLVPGNATPAAEANVWHDPEAADRVLTAGMPVTLLPLDATMRQTLDMADHAVLAASPSRTARFLAEALEQYLDFYTEVLGERRCALHDPLAVAVALGEVGLTAVAQTHVRVQTGAGPARGATVADLRTRHRGPVALAGATTEVVLETAPGFADQLVARLVTLP